MKFWFPFLSLLILASCNAGQPAGAAADASHDPDHAIKADIDSILSGSRFSGVITITQNGKPLYARAMGYADLEKGTNMSPDHQYVIGSISKQITAVLVLREYEKGNLRLEEPLGDYLPGINPAWEQKISLHHLLTHTHGITALDEPLAFQPGSQFHYSQLGYHLLALVLEKVTEKPFELLASELFAEQGMHATLHPQFKSPENLVKGYEESENGALEPTDEAFNNYVPAGAFVSNASDLIKWNENLHSGKLVRPATLELMRTRYATRNHPIFGPIDYGYGLLFKDGEQHLEIGALGYAPGFVSAAYYYPESQINLVVLQNTAHDLDDFQLTFAVHLAIMERIRSQFAP